jgi:hypothetical protein
MRAPQLGKPMQLVVLVVIFAAGIVLWCYEARGTLSQPIRILLPIGYFAFAIFLHRKVGLQFPEQSDVPFLGKRINLLDVAKSAACFLAMFFWVTVVVRIVTDTPTGAAVLLIPALTLLGASVFFLGRSFFGSPR